MRHQIAVIAVLFGQFVSVAIAQPGRSGGFGRGSSLAGLELGMPAPDVTVVDEEGNEFSLQSERGKHVVLVFGCLT